MKKNETDDLTIKVPSLEDRPKSSLGSAQPPLAVYEALFENALDAIIGMNRTGDIVSWNVMAEGIFGWLRSEVLGHKVASVIIPRGAREGHRRGLSHYLKTKERRRISKRMETKALHRSGAALDIELTIVAVGEGQEEFFFGFIRDVTWQKGAEGRLRRSEQRYRGLFETMQEPALVHDANGQIVEVNEAVSALLGYDRDELREMNGAELLEPGSVERAKEAFARVGKIGKVQFQANYLCKNGSVFNAEVFSSLCDLEGRPAVVSILRDTREQQAHLELAPAKRNSVKEVPEGKEPKRIDLGQTDPTKEDVFALHTILESSPCGLALVDESHIVQYANTVFARFIGCTPAQLCDGLVNEAIDRLNGNLAPGQTRLSLSLLSIVASEHSLGAPPSTCIKVVRPTPRTLTVCIRNLGNRFIEGPQLVSIQDVTEVHEVASEWVETAAMAITSSMNGIDQVAERLGQAGHSRESLMALAGELRAHVNDLARRMDTLN